MARNHDHYLPDAEEMNRLFADTFFFFAFLNADDSAIASAAFLLLSSPLLFPRAFGTHREFILPDYEIAAHSGLSILALFAANNALGS